MDRSKRRKADNNRLNYQTEATGCQGMVVNIIAVILISIYALIKIF